MKEKDYQNAEHARFRKEQAERDIATKRSVKNAIDTDISDDISSGCFEGGLLRAVDHILAGNYGAGILTHYNQLTTRMNRAAWLFNHAISIDYVTSLDHARKIWRSLDKDAQKRLNDSILLMIEDYDRDPVLENHLHD